MRILQLLILLLAACWQAACDQANNPASVAGTASQVQPAAASQPMAAASATPALALPPDAAKFREERELCDHFRGEEPYDAQRRRELEQQLNRYCKGTDARLAALRARYADQPRVIDALKDFDAQVE